MKQLSIQLVLVLGLGLLLGMFLPWWSVAIAGFAGSYLIRSNSARSFFGSFLGIFLLWLAMAAIVMGTTGSPMPERFAGVMGLPPNGWLLAVVSAAGGGLVAGFAGIAGRSFRGK